MPANAAQQMPRPQTQAVPPPRKKAGASKRFKTQARLLAAVCSALFTVSLGVMLYTYGNASIEFERNRRNVWARQRVDAMRERDAVRNRKNAEASPYSVEKRALQEGLSPADETKAITL